VAQDEAVRHFSLKPRERRFKRVRTFTRDVNPKEFDTMAAGKDLRVLVATDGSDHAKAAISTVARFPWPAGTRVRVVAARRTGAEYRQSILLAALDRSAEIAAESARRELAKRWPDVDAVVVDETPVNGVLAEADRFAADVIALGWRGHGPVRRLLMGSVSRGVVRAAACSVLVVRERQSVSRIVIGLDVSVSAERALAFVEKLQAPPGGRLTIVSAVDLVPAPSRRMVARAVATEVRRENTRRSKDAMKKLDLAAARLKRKGWHTRTLLTHGEPLRDLLRTVTKDRAHLLVVGATGPKGVRQLLLGSVAEGALNFCPVPVVVARQ
jgi:nucleotide-binding universal stress UspA family protein